MSGNSYETGTRFPRLLVQEGHHVRIDPTAVAAKAPWHTHDHAAPFRSHDAGGDDVQELATR